MGSINPTLVFHTAERYLTLFVMGEFKNLHPGVPCHVSRQKFLLVKIAEVQSMGFNLQPITYDDVSI